MKALVLLVLSLGFSLSYAESFEFKNSDFKSLKLANVMGNVSIAASLGDSSGVVAEKNRWGSRCSLEVKIENDVLIVNSNDKNWLLDGECRVDLVISIPTDVAADIRMGVGDLDMTGLKGALKLKVDSGLIKIRGDYQDVHMIVGTGPVQFSGSVKNINVRTHAGNVELEYKAPPQNSSITASLGRGSLLVTAPEDTRIFAEMMTGNGVVRNEFNQEKREVHLKVNARASEGDIRIMKR